MTAQEFIAKSTAVHHGVYDYSTVIYVDTKTKVEIICPTHGSFWQLPSNHVRGSGCKKCGYASSSNTQRHTTATFIEQAKAVHGDRYDYSSVEYNNSRNPVSIICPDHGHFQQIASVHVNGGNCLKCVHDNYRDTYALGTQQFINKARVVHGDKYDYSNVQYINAHTHVTITCQEHGQFLQTPTKHLAKSGCYKCGINSSIEIHKSSLDEFIIKATCIHGDRYDYSESEYISAIKPIAITCRRHGQFKQTPNSHLNGAGCVLCSYENSHNRLSADEFIKRSIEINKDLFDYSKIDYKNDITKVEIICKKHGSFFQMPTNHYKGQGCPKCAISTPHRMITNLLDDMHIQYVVNDRTVFEGLEIDVWLPIYNFGIEVNGCYWHGVRSNNLHEKHQQIVRHVDKFNSSLNTNINLYQFWDFHILDNFELIKSMISHRLSLSNRIFARKCRIIKLDNNAVKEFYNSSHLQGFRNSSVNYALVTNDVIMAAISLSRHHKHQWEIIRYACKPFSTVIGGFPKLLNRFIEDNDPKQILTFADCMISKGEIYLKNGFELVGHTKPNYFYSKNKLILSRQQCQKHKLHKLLKDGYNESLSEFENMIASGFTRVYDAGHLKLIKNF